MDCKTNDHTVFDSTLCNVMLSYAAESEKCKCNSLPFILLFNSTTLLFNSRHYTMPRDLTILL